ncbi:ATP-dependent Clp protease proteolytic subunit [Babesia caballi]|uniref:ATP-dependent Clp protease proteolytic subunit n=1 Tax=Babesia caballi TaxID=5871 RepID=A0AAV4M0N4_BABCB|nr:ATP-dependent Clp protease proteolytic subunit [Babesia caballi]
MAAGKWIAVLLVGGRWFLAAVCGWRVPGSWRRGPAIFRPGDGVLGGRDLRAASRVSDGYGGSLVSVASGRKVTRLQGEYESKLDDFYVRTRTLFLNGELDDRVAYRLVSALLRMNEQDPAKKVTFYINSPGGSVSSGWSVAFSRQIIAGMAVYDLLQSFSMPIETVCLGQAASMGAFLLASGTKGMRCAMPNSRIMIHQPLGGAHGQVSDIKIQANEILQIRQILNAHLSHFTGRPIEQIEKDCDRDNYMRPAEALEYGLIDRVCDTRTSHIVVGPALRALALGIDPGTGIGLGVDLDAAHLRELRALNPDVENTVGVADDDGLVDGVVRKLETPVEVTDLALTNVNVQVVAELLVQLVLGARAADDELTPAALHVDVVVAEAGELHQHDNLVRVGIEEGVHRRVEGDGGLKLLGGRDLKDGVLGDGGRRLVDDGGLLSLRTCERVPWQS